MPLSPQASGVNGMPGGIRQLQRPTSHRRVVRCQRHELRQPASPLPVHDRPQSLRYQKQLRLQEARQLLLAGEHRASDVALVSAMKAHRSLVGSIHGNSTRRLREMCGRYDRRSALRRGRKREVGYQQHDLL